MRRRSAPLIGFNNNLHSNMRLTHFCGAPKHGDYNCCCSKATGLTSSSEECRRTRLEKVSTYSKTVCLASARVWKQERSTHSPLSVPKNDSETALSQQFPFRLILTVMCISESLA